MSKVNWKLSKKLSERVNKLLPERLKSIDDTCGNHAAIAHCLVENSVFVAGLVIDHGEMSGHCWIENEKHEIIDPSVVAHLKKDYLEQVYYFPQIKETIWYDNNEKTYKELVTMVRSSSCRSVVLHAESMALTMRTLFRYAKKHKIDTVEFQFFPDPYETVAPFISFMEESVGVKRHEESA